MAEAVNETVENTEEKVEKAAKTGKRKPAAKKKAPAKKKAAAKKQSESKDSVAARAQEAGREVYLATLGFYGKAFEVAQERIEERRKQSGEQYKDMVKHGEKVESELKERIEKLELPKIDLDNLADREKLEEQMEKVKARFEELKEIVIGKKAA